MNAIAPNAVTLDDLHDQAIDSACDLDRAYAEAHPEARRRVRELVPHELCVPGYACGPLTGHVLVILFAPGIRGRTPVELPPAVLA